MCTVGYESCTLFGGCRETILDLDNGVVATTYIILGNKQLTITIPKVIRFKT